VQYKVDESYYPEFDRAIAWNDPDIAIDWDVTEPIISKKDIDAPTLKSSDMNFTMEKNP
jgi:dTDP-4-dehydrorhamnose 3,5-epimerase-like enzyme